MTARFAEPARLLDDQAVEPGSSDWVLIDQRQIARSQTTPAITSCVHRAAGRRTA